MKRTTADLEAAHALAQDQSPEAQANVARLRYSTPTAAGTLSALRVERDETEKT